MGQRREDGGDGFEIDGGSRWSLGLRHSGGGRRRWVWVLNFDPPKQAPLAHLGDRYMVLRRYLGFSGGEPMRSDAKPCSRLMRQTGGIFSVGGAFGFWILCRLHYGMC
ncbi:hypothetical protein RHMOL_Rhmol11G0165300 [Rhododendron molle]|uniref:Uncharacterized protein n=1 Tax=Rhododendron molle TaxID=49168 RepID=A0ACC0LSQ8_RHOML|nr:hypothetical protein RHMOL_Rhmol11G0165300 [Rhododendron molle]